MKAGTNEVLESVHGIADAVDASEDRKGGERHALTQEEALREIERRTPTLEETRDLIADVVGRDKINEGRPLTGVSPSSFRWELEECSPYGFFKRDNTAYHAEVFEVTPQTIRNWKKKPSSVPLKRVPRILAYLTWPGLFASALSCMPDDSSAPYRWTPTRYDTMRDTVEHLFFDAERRRHLELMKTCTEALNYLSNDDLKHAAAMIHALIKAHAEEPKQAAKADSLFDGYL